MWIIKINKEGKDFTFCTNGKIMPIELNVPMQFDEAKEAKQYLNGYNHALTESGINPISGYEFIDLKDNGNADNR
jgi:hypothetical protein